MCNIVYINKIVICESIKEFKDKLHIKEENIVYNFGYTGYNERGCLCPVDLPKTLRKAGIIFKVEKDSDYLIEK